MSALDRYVRHAEHHGTEQVFETAAGLGVDVTPDTKPALTIVELINLARRLKQLDPAWRFPDLYEPHVEGGEVRHFDNGVVVVPDGLNYHTRRQIAERGQRREQFLAPVLDAIATPAPVPAGRVCERCGRAIAGRSDRRTCSKACREALRRARGVGAFSRPRVAPTEGSDPSIAPRRTVAPTPPSRAGNDRENRGVWTFREAALTEASAWP